MKLKLCKMFTTLACTKIVFLIAVANALCCCGNLKLPLTYNEKGESRLLLLSHCRYFDNVLQKCPLGSPLPNIWLLSKWLNLIGCLSNQSLNLRKEYSKIIYSEAVWGMKLKRCRNVHNHSGLTKCVFIAVAHVHSLLWHLKVSIDL